MKNQPHILYAEDDPDTRELVQLFLRQAGFRVSVTGDSSEVLSLVATDHIDALLLDNWMPAITGLELCRRIRSFDQTMPILFCSGAVTEADKKAALSAGAQGYIGKPFDPEDLITTLRAALNIETT
jgi:DNA-binding response OmpR family regulator